MLSVNVTDREVGVDALKFIAIIMVVFIHVGNELPASFDSGGFTFQSVTLFLKQFITNGISRVAVPIFFFISGYLASRQWGARGYFYRLDILKRTKTILVPYLMWSLVLFSIFWLVQLSDATHKFFNKGLIQDMLPGEALSTLYITPIPYQLWFLRDLYVLFLLGPILFAAVKKTPIIFFILLVPLWLTNINFFLSTEGVLFFSMGLFFGLGKYNFNLGMSLRSAMIMWIIISASSIYFKLVGFSEWMLLTKLQILWGSMLMLKVADAGVFNNLARYSIYTLPVFFFHEPLLTLVKKLVAVTLPHTPLIDLVIFFAAPVLVILASAAVSIKMAQIMPTLYNLLLGGRTFVSHPKVDAVFLDGNTTLTDLKHYRYGQNK